MNFIKIRRLFFITIYIFGCVSISVAAFAGEVLVIANAKGPLTTISEREIKAIFLGEKRFAGDIQILPIVLEKDAAIRDQFLSAIMQMSIKEYRIHWTKKVFQDGIHPPASKDSTREVIDAVKQQPGAIGYINREVFGNEPEIRIVKTIK